MKKTAGKIVLLVCCLGLWSAASPVVGAGPDWLFAPEAKPDVTQMDLEALLETPIMSVEGVSKHKQKISEAPASVTIIDSEEISRYGHRNFAEVLRSARGLYVSYDRNYNYLGIRGFNRPGDFNSRLLLLVDGHRVNENVLDSVLIGNEFPVDVDLIERVEVIRGPGSSIYGNNAFFGVINVITKSGSRMNGGEVSGAYGTFDTYKGRVSYGTKFKNGVEMLLSGSYFDTKGDDKLYYREYESIDDPGSGFARNADYETFYKGFLKLSYSDFTLEGAYSQREKGIPTGAYESIFDDNRARTFDDRAFLGLKYKKEFGNEWEIMSRVAYDYYDYRGTYPIQFVSGRLGLYKDYALGHWWSTEMQVAKRLFDRLRLTAGVEYRDNFAQDQGSKDEDDPPSVDDIEKDSKNVGVYAQTEFNVLTNLILNAGARFDHFDTFGNTANPRLGLIYSPIEITTFKALYGTAFKAPNAYELYYEGPNNGANPDLEPETISTYELVYEQWIGPRMRFTTTAFYYTIEDLITPREEGGRSFYRNVDEVDAKGVEVGMAFDLNHGIRSRVSYSYQETQDLSTKRELSNSPRHLAKFNLMVPLYPKRIFGGFELQYSSRARTLDGERAQDFVVANLTLLCHPFTPKFDLSFSIHNLFDKRHFYPGGLEHEQDLIEQDGRTFRVKGTYRF